jgi:uncharacterized membrane protein SpoIIM required for sporulation
MAYPINNAHHGRRTIIVPPTTDMALVFPFDHENKKFDKGFYSPFLTDGRASSGQIEGFLKEAEEAFKKKLKWLHRLRAYLVFGFVTGLFFMFMYSLTIFSGVDDDYYYSYNDHNNQQATSRHNHNSHNKNFRHHNRTREYDIEEQIEIMFMGWIVLCFAAIIWSVIYRCVKRSCFKNARKGVQEVVDRYAPIFASSGLRWNLPLAFPHYIELWKDYRGQNLTQNLTQPSKQMSHNANPLAFNQIYNQLQNQNQNQRYPTLNQVIDQRACLDFQNNGPTSPLLNNQAQRREANIYVPPYPINFASNTKDL